MREKETEKYSKEEDMAKNGSARLSLSSSAQTNSQFPPLAALSLISGSATTEDKTAQKREKNICD
jgi:hypothetical protein